jgi:secreted trypsin-like serine protease
MPLPRSRLIAALLGLLLAGAVLAAGALGSPAGPTGQVLLDRAVAARLLAQAREPLIVGGSPADPGEYPWVVFVLEVLPDGPDPDTDPDLGGACTGSLIGTSWILTAAHCVSNLTTGELEALGAVVVIGSLTVDPAEVAESNLYVTDSFVTFGFDPQSNANDLVLLRLAEPAPDEAIVLAGPTDGDLWAPDTLATIAGWGDTAEEGEPSAILLEAQLPIVDDATCGLVLPAGAFDPSTQLCAGYPEGGVDTCQGDSGGPLMVPNGYGGFLQAGVVSFGFGCARPNSPGVYTRVAAYTEAIVSALAADDVAPVGDPGATTGRALRIKRTSARLTGTVRPNGLAAHAFIEIGKTRLYGRFVEGYADSGYGETGVSAVFRRLKPNTLYHYRVGVWTSAGVVVGADRTFRTKP